MIVTGITPVTKQKYKVELDGRPAFVLYKGELARYGVQLEQELTDLSYHVIVHEVLTRRAKKYVMHLLTKLDRTKKELEEKLKRNGYPEEAVSAAIAYVESYGYLNDKQYAKNYIQAYSGKLSKKQICWKLMGKGIESQTIESVCDELQQTDESATVRKYIQKKLKNNTKLTDKELKKLADYLYRRGFEDNVIREALRCYQRDDEDDFV